MNKTPIEWTDFTVNPFRFRNSKTGKVGHHCAKISPGCKNCYSSTMQSGPYLSGLTFIEENKSKGEFFLDEAVLQQVLRRKKPARIFWCDMTDMFLEDYPDEWIDRCFAVMALTPQHTHQVLTKRAKRMREYFADSIRRGGLVERQREAVYNKARREPVWYPTMDWPLPNVHLGVSVEDQQRADERIPLLLQTPAAVRFVSVEPLLGPVDLKFPAGVRGPAGFPNGFEGWTVHARSAWFEMQARATYMTRCETVDWVIVGGESGPDARPCDLAWIRSIVAQCKAAGVACFVKQLGAKAISNNLAWALCSSCGWVGLNSELPRDSGENPHLCGADLCPECGVGGYICCCYASREDAENDERVGEGSTALKLKDRKGGDMAEWPADLRLREMPRAQAGVAEMQARPATDCSNKRKSNGTN